MNKTPLLSLILLTSITLRVLVAIHPHSGQGVSPMFGDYEAQRHWMEITLHVPVRQWYQQTEANDLQYWGLDYPPFTAYVSWIFGYLGDKLDPSWMELYKSRGNESLELKFYMRSTVLFCDILVLFTAVCAFYFTISRSHSLMMQPQESQYINYALLVWVFALLIQPSTILIDHGHFQYNCVMLGLTLWSIVCLFQNRLLWSSFFFCLSLSFKQMALYYSPVFFFYLLGKCFQEPTISRKLLLLIKIGIVVLFTFTLMFLPYLSDIASIGQVIHRIFPVARGLFEDKVANFWCAASLVVKFKSLYDAATWFRISVGTTLLCILPGGFHLLLHPTMEHFLYYLVNCSLSFFLFSFQVHEKTILLVVLPISLLLLREIRIGGLFILVAHFSIYPLFKKDFLVIPYIALGLLWIGLWKHLERTTISPKPKAIISFASVEDFIYSFRYPMYLGMMIYHVVDATVTPPSHLPDLFVMLNVLESTFWFFLVLLYFTYHQFTLRKSDSPCPFLPGGAGKKKLKSN